MNTTIETIAAIATAPGHGGVGIIRISGPTSHAILGAIFKATNPKFSKFKPWLLHHGHIVEALLPPKSEHAKTKIGHLLVQMPEPVAFEGSGGLCPPLEPFHKKCSFEAELSLDILDEVLVVAMPGPKTYTGEDVAEIHCHGGLQFCKASWSLCCKKVLA